MRVRLTEMTKRLGTAAVVTLAALALAMAGCDSGGDGDGGNGGNNGGNGGADVVGGDGTTGGGDTGGPGGDPDSGGTGGDPDTGGTGGDPDTGGTGGPDGGGTGGPDGGTGTQENCINGTDDDGDGDVDCADSDCSTSPACKEDCDDGADNDGDGLADCDDDDCAQAAACSEGPESCNDMYLCLIEKGCDCTLGVDCPEGDGVGPCLQSCFSDEDCYNGCLGELTLDTQTAWGNWQQCLSGNCANASGDAFESCYVGLCLNEYANCFFGCGDDHGKDPKANKDALVECTTAECQGLEKEADLSGCYFDNCIEEATQCLYDGDATCEQGFFGCYVDCPQNDQECASECIGSLSSQGAYDLFSWDGCRFDLCDGDGDGSADSTDCLVASFLACSDKMGSCNEAGWPGTDACNATVDCVIGCGGFGNNASTCLDGCLATMSNDATGSIGALFTCAISTCGTTAEALSTACIEAALANECAAEATTCGYTAAPTENCTDKADNDGDGAIDCDDTDCATDAACQVAVEDCGNGTDDDGDGMTDCDDEDCSSESACIAEICDNGTDDDGDGATDCDDDECSADAACQ